jgi:hypothetical protein
MKKILSTLILFITFHLGLLFLAVSCETATDKVTISKSEYQKLKGDTLQSEYPKPFKLYTEGLSGFDTSKSDGIVLGSDKHEYLVWNYGRHSCNVEHYVDCKLCKSREITIKK